MRDCIYREAVKDAICIACSIDSDYHKCDGYAENSDWCDYMVAIRALPAADVAPVVRGKWLTGNDNPRTYGRIRAMCGRCGAFALAEMVNAGSYKEQLSNFCPNCGARMEES